MTVRQTTRGPRGARPGRGFLWAALVFFLGFAVNIVIGKIAILQGATETPGLGDVGEFLTLFVAVALFIAACLVRERERAENTANKASNNTGGKNDQEKD